MSQIGQSAVIPPSEHSLQPTTNSTNVPRIWQTHPMICNTQQSPRSGIMIFGGFNVRASDWLTHSSNITDTAGGDAEASALVNDLIRESPKAFLIAPILIDVSYRNFRGIYEFDCWCCKSIWLANCKSISDKPQGSQSAINQQEPRFVVTHAKRPARMPRTRIYCGNVPFVRENTTVWKIWQSARNRNRHSSCNLIFRIIGGV